MGNHGYDPSTDPGEIMSSYYDAEYFAWTVDEATRLINDND
jgi:hypothetical protein